MILRACIVLLAIASATSAPAQTRNPSPAPVEQWQREHEERLRSDWPWLARYQAADAQLAASSKEPRIVFIGDSITQGWYDQEPGFFVAGRIGRGIAGQTTPQLLLRFRQDVLSLHPAVVQIMAGANDIAGNTGPMTLEQTEGNIRSMTELAQAHGVRVILGSVPPATRLPWRPGLAVADKIRALNAWLRGYAAATGSIYADYWSVLQDGQGGFHPGWSLDGAHPNRIGYAVMMPVAQKAISEALARPAPQPLPIAEVP